ncbi:hypothetical protein LguiB_021377 [Lonicera macranthoides]
MRTQINHSLGLLYNSVPHTSYFQEQNIKHLVCLTKHVCTPSGRGSDSSRFLLFYSVSRRGRE